MHVIVLGAGVIGTTTAWYLARDGHQVTVIERQPAAAMETSFANGGQISVSHAEPWANPHTLPKALKWLGREDAPLLVRWNFDPAFFAWGLRFLGECFPARTRQNIGAIVGLALYSRSCLQELRRELPSLDYDQLQRGILHIYTDPRELEAAAEASRIMREFGLDREMVSVDRCLEIEPALMHSRHLLAGGDFTPSDESGDVHRFTQMLATECCALGVEFRYEHCVEQMTRAGGQISSVRVRSAEGVSELQGDAYVVAMGSYSPLLLKPLGIRLPVYPAKGYSATIPLGDDSVAPRVALTDDARKIVTSRLGQRLRVAGTAEFNGYNLDLTPVRCQALMTRILELFPELHPAGEPDFWCGLRPTTPSNVPYVGRSRFANLWLNTGHGTLGWTMACGSAAALTEQLAGRQPAVAVRGER